MLTKKNSKHGAGRIRVRTRLSALLVAAAVALGQVPASGLALASDGTDTNLLTVKVWTEGGSVFINKGEDDEQYVRVDDYDGVDYIDAYDKDDVLISSVEAEENGYSYIYETTDAIVSLDAEADDGYEVSWVWDASSEENVLDEAAKEFSYWLFMGSNESVSFEFTKSADETAASEAAEKADEAAAEEAAKKAEREAEAAAEQAAKDAADAADQAASEAAAKAETSTGTGITGETNLAGLGPETESPVQAESAGTEDVSGSEAAETVQETDDALIVAPGGLENAANIEAAAEADAEVETEVETEIETEIETEEADTEAGTEADTEADAEALETETDIQDSASEETENSAQTEAVVFTGENVDALLNVDDFISARLVVVTDKGEDIPEPKRIIANYENLYLIQYDTIEQAMEAYSFFLDFADAVEPDAILGTAEEEFVGTDPIESQEFAVTEDENPILALTEADGSAEVQKEQNCVIALIDTGASESVNVIDRMSLIDDAMEGNGHGNDMVSAIVSQNPGARILSIRAMGDDGKGTLSSIVAAIEYAMEQGVDMINLSLYAKNTLSNSVLGSEIRKAVSMGIEVVGAAGNAGEDASGYMPGAVDEAWIIGACDENGARLPISNYGDTVDYYVVSNSTSEAAALFSGYASLYGFGSVTDFNLLKTEVTEPDDTVPEVSAPEVTKEDTENAIIDAVIENYVMENADPAYTAVDKIEFAAVLSIKNTLVDSDMVEDGWTIEDIMFGEEAIAAFITQIPAVSAVYNLSDESEYYVSFADTMHFDGTSRIMDTAMANNDLWGNAIYDYIYDSDTGLVYIPKAHYTIDGQTYMDAIQMQFLRKTYLEEEDENFYIASPVTTVVDDNEGITTESTSEDAFEYTTNIVVEKNLDLETLVVAINGVPVPEGYYTYDPDSGNLGLYVSSAAIQNVSVYCDGRDYDQEAATAAGVTYAKMSAVNTAANKAQVDIKTLKQLKVYRGTVTVWFHADGMDNYTGDEDLGMPIYFYAGTPNSYGSASESQSRALDIMLYSTGFLSDSEANLNGNGNVMQYTSNKSSTEADGKWTIDLSSINLKKAKTASTTDSTWSNVTDPVDWDDLDYGSTTRVNVRSYCVHIEKYLNTKTYKNWYEMYDDILVQPDGSVDDTGTGTAKWSSTKCVMRPLKVYDGGTTEQSYVVFSIVTQQADSDGNQNGMGLFKLIVEDIPRGSISVTKKSSNTAVTSSNSNYSLAGAVYGVYTDSACTSLYESMTTDSNGNASVSELPLGTYYVQEITPSPGYTRDTNKYPVTLSSSVKSATVSSAETPLTGDVTLYKSSSLPDMTTGNNCYSLDGAVYGIYTNAACTTLYGTMTTSGGAAKKTGLPFGTYYVKEISASTGFELNTTVTSFTVTQSAPSATIKTGAAVETARNDPLGITITKIWAGDETPTVPTLAGTQFTIRYYDNMNKDTSGAAKKTWVIEIKKVNGTYTAVLNDTYLVTSLSDSLYYKTDGTVILPYGTYAIQETKPAAGYTLNGYLLNANGERVSTNSSLYVTLVDANSTSSGNLFLIGGNEYSGYNTPIDTSIKIVKKNSSGKPLAGVEYELQDSNGNVVSTGKTNSAGEATFSGLYPDIYTITELKTVEGYSLLVEPFTVETPTRVTEQDIEEYNIDESKLTYDPADNIYYIFDLTYEITDTATFKMPMTGTSGFWKFGIIGMALIAAVSAGMFAYGSGKKRRIRKIG